MNNWNSTINGNPTISGMYIVTIETNDKFRTDPPPHRHVTEGEYYAPNHKYGRSGWYFPDFSDDRCGEPELAEELGYRVVAWQAMPETYMGE